MQKISMRIRKDSVEDFLRFAPETWEISYVTTNGEIVIGVGENRVTFAGDGVLEIARMTWADTVGYGRVDEGGANWGGQYRADGFVGMCLADFDRQLSRGVKKYA
mgnify:CR=1 FL=1